MKVLKCKICSQTTIIEDFLIEENICKNCKMLFIEDAKKRKNKKRNQKRRNKNGKA